MTSTTHGNSPLRLESDADESGWVKRTEDVHLDNSDGKGGEDAHANGERPQEQERSTLQEHYSQLLGEW